MLILNLVLRGLLLLVRMICLCLGPESISSTAPPQPKRSPKHEITTERVPSEKKAEGSPPKTTEQKEEKEEKKGAERKPLQRRKRGTANSVLIKRVPERLMDISIIHEFFKK